MKWGVPGERPALPFCYYCFFFVFFAGAAFGLTYCVCTCPVSASSIAFAASALGPVGVSSRYLSNSPFISGGATVLPSEVTVIFDDRHTAYWKCASAYVGVSSMAFLKVSAAWSYCPAFTSRAPRL